MYYYTTTTSLSDPEWVCVYSSFQAPVSEIATPDLKAQEFYPEKAMKLSLVERIVALEWIVKHNMDDAALRRVDIAELLGVGLTRVKDDLRMLEARGKVYFVGVGSHSGHWHIAGDPETAEEVEAWIGAYEGRAISDEERTMGDPEQWKEKCVIDRRRRVAKAIGKTALRCAGAAVLTPYIHNQEVRSIQYKINSPYPTKMSRLWQYALEPLKDLSGGAE